MVQERTHAVTPVDDGRRLVLTEEGHSAWLGYRLEPGRLVIVHTEVPEELAGKGVGGQLVAAAVARANDEHLTVVPWCPFARRWLEQHHEVAATTTIDWDSRPTR